MLEYGEARRHSAEACSVSDAQIDGQICLLVKENRFDDDEL
jgi:hypothetical protein